MISPIPNRYLSIVSFLNFRWLKKNWAIALIFGLTLSLLFTACNGGGKAKVVRIGYQRVTDLEILKTRGTLEERLKPEGITVEWSLFNAGPPLMEALGANQLDLGGVGEVPPIFAQAAGADLLYVATKPPVPQTYGILVPKNSSIKTLADLKGKKVAFVRGSSAHFLLVAALKSAGLQITDIVPAYLPASDARPALTQGRVDAWAIWDPFLSSTQASGDATLLVDGTGLGNNTSFIISSRSFAESNPELLKIVLEELQKSDDWAKANIDELTKEFAPLLNLPPDIAKKILARRSYGVLPIDQAVLEKQQEIANIFFDLKLIPKQIDVNLWAWKAPT